MSWTGPIKPHPFGACHSVAISDDREQELADRDLRATERREAPQRGDGTRIVAAFQTAVALPRASQTNVPGALVFKEAQMIAWVRNLVYTIAVQDAEPAKLTGALAVETPGYELRSANGRGEGVYASCDYRRGQIVLVGRIEAEVPGNHSHASQVARDRFVLHGGLISKVNHSCSPNCGIHVNETGAHDFVARHHIPTGVELTFDYAMRNYTIEYFPERCRCGATGCRGSITGWKDLPPELKRAYHGLVAPYLLDLDAEAAGSLRPRGDRGEVQIGRTHQARVDVPPPAADGSHC